MEISPAFSPFSLLRRFGVDGLLGKCFLDGVSLKGSRERLNGDGFNVGEVINDYLTWLEQIFYVLVYRFNYNKGDYEYGAFRSPKRGDELYAERVLRRFDRLSFRLKRKLFYHVKARLRFVRGKVLHIVLEYDTNRFGLKEAWERCGGDFNRFMSHLKRHFGRCSNIRCFEAHESAVCHIHLMVLFHNREFQGKRTRKKNLQGRRFRWVYRIFGED